MRHLIFQENSEYPVAVLTKTSSFNQYDLQRHYVTPLVNQGVPTQQIIGFTLAYENNKAPAKLVKDYLSKLLPALTSIGSRYLYVCDSTYFKALTGVPKSEGWLGYALPCKIKGYEHLQVILGLNHQQLIYNPALQSKLDQSLATLAALVQGRYQAPGTSIIQQAHYPESLEDIRETLQNLLDHPALTCDIEGFSLRHDHAGIGTIAFAWDQHHGTAFAVDYQPTLLSDGRFHVDCPQESAANHHGFKLHNPAVKALLREFFERYRGRLIFHNATFDIKILIFNLWMQDGLDTAGLLKGLECLTRHFDDTKIIAYLATNSTAGNVLGLKPLAQEFAGNYAQDEINDIRRIPLPKLLEYNLVDCLCTWYVHDKYVPVMVADRQETLYRTLMLPTQQVITQMELTGMPMDPAKVQEVKRILQKKQQESLDIVMHHPVIQMLNLLVQTRQRDKTNAGLKTKQHPLEKFSHLTFNPNSGPQLQTLLYDLMGLPVLDYTDTRQPATGADTLAKLIHHTEQAEYKAILQALIDYGKVTKILTAFIPAFEQAVDRGDGVVYLHGSFNLGGTVSGRLSSSDPNLQNIPANSLYGKLIKLCFKGPAGWLFVGADFASLEDRINTLLTKDPNKIKVYTDGYDGHALRAFAYFGDQMPDIDDSVASINSLANKASPYYELRQESKAPTFALTYQGTYRTMMTNLGWPEEKARKVEENYRKLYQVSIQWVQDRIAEASHLGYAEACFGLRIRTPLLAQAFLGKSSTPREVEAEARTLGNAISGQSYGQLNNRAMVAFMRKVWAHPEYRLLVKPVAMIHDAIYLLIAERPDVVEWVNRELIVEMEWQDLPEIAHDQVKLGAELDLYWPDWAHPLTLPNGIDQTEIIDRCRKHRLKLQEEQQAA